MTPTTPPSPTLSDDLLLDTLAQSLAATGLPADDLIERLQTFQGTASYYIFIGKIVDMLGYELGYTDEDFAAAYLP